MPSHIIMVAGLPGTGKTTAAERLESGLEYDLHTVLGIRREFDHKKYSLKQDPTVFAELYERVRKSLQNGTGVIVDTANKERSGRKKIYDIALYYDSDVVILECYCSEMTAKKRMRSKPKSDGLVTDPRDPRVYEKLAMKWEDIQHDMECFPDYPLSYLRYNTEIKDMEEVRVSPETKPLVNSIKQILSEQD